jgi:hypothetical protein
MLCVNFTSQDYLRDPVAGVTKLRAAGPVVQVSFPIVARAKPNVAFRRYDLTMYRVTVMVLMTLAVIAAGVAPY